MHNVSRRCLGLVALAAASVFVGQPAHAATQYFDVNGTAAGSGLTEGQTYSWEDANWALGSASLGTGTTGTWVEGNFPEFATGSDASNTVSYTVTANANHTIAGMYLHYSTSAAVLADGGKNVTINGTGSFTIASGYQGFLISNAAQNLIINSSLIGSGGIVQQSGGQLSLYGNNSFSGGFVTTGGQLTNYNNANSFGAGSINFISTGTTSIQGLVKSGAAALTIPNNIAMVPYNTVQGGANTNSNTGVNFVSGGTLAAPGTTFTGTVTLPSTGVGTFVSNSAVQSVTKFSGAIGGTGGLTLGGNNASNAFIFAAPSTYTGVTTLGVTGAGSITLALGVNNAIASSSSLVLGGGTLATGGFSQTGTTVPTLGLAAASTIDFGSLASTLDFADSSALTWTGTINLVGFNSAIDVLNFGSATGLTTTQLAAFNLNGSPANASLDSSGNLVVAPEPASIALLGVGSLLLAGRRRAKA